MTAHIMGLPIEESVVQLAPAGAVMMTAVVIAGRTGLGRLLRRLRHTPRLRGQEPSSTGTTGEETFPWS